MREVSKSERARTGGSERGRVKNQYEGKSSARKGGRERDRKWEPVRVEGVRKEELKRERERQEGNSGGRRQQTRI